MVTLNMFITVTRSPTGTVTMVKGRLNLEDKSYAGTVKLTWLPTVPTTPTTVVHFDHLITKAILKPNDDFKDYVNKNTRVCCIVYTHGIM